MDEHEQCKREMAAAEAHIRALEAEVARKDAALRRLIEHTEAMEAQNADYHRLGEQGIPCRSAPLNEAAAALGPWMPTHQHENGTLAREVVRAQFGVGADGLPVVILEDVFHRPFVVAAEKVGRDFHPLTPDEARAAVEGRS